jgi:hypothetical protein
MGSEPLVDRAERERLHTVLAARVDGLPLWE